MHTMALQSNWPHLKGQRGQRVERKEKNGEAKISYKEYVAMIQIKFIMTFVSGSIK